MRDHLYMFVTADKYELPVFVGTAPEVAKFAGVKEMTVRTLAYKYEKYGMPSRYIRVEFED